MLEHLQTELVERRLGEIAKVFSLVILVALAITWFTQQAANAALEVRLETAQADLARERQDVADLQQQLKSKDQRAQAIGREVAGELERRSKLLVTMGEIVKRVDQLQQQKDAFEHRRGEIAQELSRMDQMYLRAQSQSPNIKP